MIYNSSPNAHHTQAAGECLVDFVMYSKNKVICSKSNFNIFADVIKKYFYDQEIEVIPFWIYHKNGFISVFFDDQKWRGSFSEYHLLKDGFKCVYDYNREYVGRNE